MHADTIECWLCDAARVRYRDEQGHVHLWHYVGGNGATRLSATPVSAIQIVPWCSACARRCSADGHVSTTCSSTAVLSTSSLVSTSAPSSRCCRRAVSRSTCLTQLKLTQSDRPSELGVASSRRSASARPLWGFSSAMNRNRPAASNRATSTP